MRRFLPAGAERGGACADRRLPGPMGAGAAARPPSALLPGQLTRSGPTRSAASGPPRRPGPRSPRGAGRHACRRLPARSGASTAEAQVRGEGRGRGGRVPSPRRRAPRPFPARTCGSCHLTGDSSGHSRGGHGRPRGRPRASPGGPGWRPDAALRVLARTSAAARVWTDGRTDGRMNDRTHA